MTLSRMFQDRNFGYKWKTERFSATHKCSMNFHGDSAFSEPETAAIRVKFRKTYFFKIINYLTQDFLLKSKGRIKLFLTVHAAGKILVLQTHCDEFTGEKIIIPWGHNNETFDKTLTINRLMEAGR